MINLPDTHRFLYLLLVLAICSGLMAIRLLLNALIEVGSKPTLLTYGELFASTVVILGQIIIGAIALAVLIQ